MPELAEVEFFRKRWHLAAVGQRVISVAVHANAKVFRGSDPDALAQRLPGKRLLSSETAAKQMLFRFSGQCWLGIHLGMSGDLYVKSADYVPEKHDHLVLFTKQHSLVLTDPRMFGRVLFHTGPSHRTGGPRSLLLSSRQLSTARQSVNSSSGARGHRSKRSCSCRNVSPASAIGWPTRSSGARRFIPNGSLALSRPLKSIFCGGNADGCVSWLWRKSQAKVTNCRLI